MTCNYHQDSDWWEVTKEGGMIILSDILSSHVTPRQSMLKMTDTPLKCLIKIKILRL